MWGPNWHYHHMATTRLFLEQVHLHLRAGRWVQAADDLAAAQSHLTSAENDLDPKQNWGALRKSVSPMAEWVEVGGQGRYILEGPGERVHCHPLSGITTGTQVNTVGGHVVLEASVMLGQGVMLLTGTHDYRKYGEERRNSTYQNSGADIVIREGALIGSGVIVTGPCEIGAHAVVQPNTWVKGVVPAFAKIGPPMCDDMPWRFVKDIRDPGVHNVANELRVGPINKAQLTFDRNWVGPPELKPKVYRTQTEKDVWYGCVVEDEYKCPLMRPDDVVIDIGAHIGSFSFKAYLQGSRSVYAFEIDPWHFAGAEQNLAEMDDGVLLHSAAVVRGDEHRSKSYHYDGVWNSFGLFGEIVSSISLDEILEPHESVRFLKIDCEGGEWPILYTSKQLHKIQEIAGEYHIIAGGRPELDDLPYPITAAALESFLQSQGFETEFREGGGPNIGNFRAKRTGKVAFDKGLAQKNYALE